MKHYQVLLTGGGTLGSVTPLLALVAAATQQGLPYRFSWVGTRRGPERTLLQTLQIPYYPLVAGKWRRYFSTANLASPLLTVFGFFQAMYLLYRLRPDAVLSAGAFVSVPVVWAAWCQGIPIFLHEQDEHDGLANRLMRRFAAVRTSVWPKSGTIPIGNCIRPSLYASGAPQTGISEQGVTDPVVLVTGGGTGAERLNQLVVAALPELTKFAVVLHNTGAHKTRGGTYGDRYHAFTFAFDERREHYAAADVVLTRAGMATLSELAALKKAAIVIPMPHTHQEQNAAVLSRAGAAIVCSEPLLTADTLTATIRELLQNRARRVAMADALHRLIPDGTKSFLRLLQEVLQPSA